MKVLSQEIERIVVSEQQIVEACQRLGAQITEDYKDKNPVLVGALKGAVPFIAELIKYIDTHIEIDFIDVSSYHGGTESTGEITINRDIATSLNNRDVLIIEDIIDTGQTLKRLVELLASRGANSVKVVTLTDKPSGRVVEMVADYVGVVVPEGFLVGFGLDYRENYRNLPYIGILKEEMYK